MRHLFILNPVAGKGRTVRLVPDIHDYFRGKSREYIIETTEYPGHATEIAARYSSRGDWRIYSIGGDGTLNEVLNGMAGSGSSLAAIPGGSGNDFIKSVIGSRPLKDMVKNIIEGEEKLIDLAKVNDKYFINITSLGFDAQVVLKTMSYKKLPLISGKLAYMLGILASIMKCENHDMEIVIDGRPLKTKTLLVAVGNGKYYGGGMLALPEADINDGLLEICLVEEKKRLDILHLFPKYMKGLHGSIPGVHFFKAKNVEIIPDRSIPMNLDGEVFMSGRAGFEIIKDGLRFVTPVL
jgi:YegS/Rv2252/BmrU family lipid kinase